MTAFRQFRTRLAHGGNPVWAMVFCFLLICLCYAPGIPAGEYTVISGKTVWQGRVEVSEDLLITETGHLIINAGSEVIIKPSEGTRTDPHFFSTGTEIIVRGKLETAGLDGAKVVFKKAESGLEDSWAGIIADGQSARVVLDSTIIRGAESGITVINAALKMRDCEVLDCRYGVTLLGRAKATLNKSIIHKNTYGLADYSEGTMLDGTRVEDNFEKDYLGPPAGDLGYRSPEWYRLTFRQNRPSGEVEYLGEHSIGSDTTWEGRIVIRGQVVVQPGATLTIAPGTEVAFRRMDTNGDGLGESLLLILGSIRVRGTEENWVLFTSAEKEKKPGDWDKISLIASESEKNIIRFARFEYGYQAFHNHFSNVRMEGVIFNDNYRGVQFQESGSTRIDGAYFTANKSAMRFRDSNVELSDCLVKDNISGVNFLRCRASISDSVITGCLFDPLLGRESATELTAVMVVENREGPRFKGEGSKLDMKYSAVYRNLEDGLSLSGTEASISSSECSRNGLDGVSVDGGQVRIEMCAINGNGRWAVDNNGETIIDARGTFWGFNDASSIEKAIFDRRDDSSLGRVLILPFITTRPGLAFPGLVEESGIWNGEIMVIGDFSWPAGELLAIAPGTVIEFYPLNRHSPLDLRRDHPYFVGSEINITGGEVRAVGKKNLPIRFRALKKEERSSAWGAVNLEKVKRAHFVRCVFEGAETALHLRESSGSVIGCLFYGNIVGLRFFGSPVNVADNVFLRNQTGLRFHYGEPAITGNLFKENRKAVFISRDPGRMSMTGNNFIDNGDYSINLGEEVTMDIEIPGNYWGTVDAGIIESGFFDKRVDADLGLINYKPPASVPLKIPSVPKPSDGGS